jgi:hypothetical protein
VPGAIQVGHGTDSLGSGFCALCARGQRESRRQVLHLSSPKAGPTGQAQSTVGDQQEASGQEPRERSQVCQVTAE